MIFLQLLCLALLGLPLLRLLPAFVVSKPLLTLVGTAQQAAKQMIQAYMAGDGAGIAMTAPTYPQMGGGMGNPAMGYGGMGYGGYPAAGGYGQMGGYPQGLAQAPFPPLDLPELLIEAHPDPSSTTPTNKPPDPILVPLALHNSFTLFIFLPTNPFQTSVRTTRTTHLPKASTQPFIPSSNTPSSLT